MIVKIFCAVLVALGVSVAIVLGGLILLASCVSDIKKPAGDNSFWGSSGRIKNGIPKVENAYGQSTLHFIILYEKLGRVEKVIGKIPAYNLCT